jgi:hypothetical protein
VPIEWENLVNLSYSGNNQTVIKPNPPNAWDAWARSANQFDAGEKASLYYTVEGNPTNNRGFVIAIGEYTASYGLTNVAYGFKIQNTQIQLIENGLVVGSVAKTGGEELQLVRKQNSGGSWKVKYKINGTNEHTANASGALYHAYVLVRRAGAEVKGTTAGDFLKIDRTASNCPGNNGSIQLETNAGVPPYDYSWADGATGANRTNLSPGQYEVEISDAVGNTLVKNIRVFSEINWKEETNVITASTEIQVVSGSGASEARTNNVLTAGNKGFVEFQPLDQGGAKIFALWEEGTVPGSPFLNGFLFSGSEYQLILDNTPSGTFTPYASTDKFKVVRSVNGNFKYFVNGVQVGSNTGANTLDHSIYAVMDFGSQGFTNIRATFCDADSRLVCSPVKRKLDGVRYESADDRIHFCYNEEYDPQNPYLTYRIFADNNRVVPEITGTTQAKPVSYGDNRYQVNITAIPPGTYVLEVENNKEERFYLRFLK